MRSPACPAPTMTMSTVRAMSGMVARDPPPRHPTHADRRPPARAARDLARDAAADPDVDPAEADESDQWNQGRARGRHPRAARFK